VWYILRAVGEVTCEWTCEGVWWALDLVCLADCVYVGLIEGTLGANRAFGSPEWQAWLYCWRTLHADKLGKMKKGYGLEALARETNTFGMGQIPTCCEVLPHVIRQPMVSRPTFGVSKDLIRRHVVRDAGTNLATVKDVVKKRVHLLR